MAIESKSKEINGRVYTVPTLPTFEALDTLELLTKLLGPGIAALESAGLDGDIQPAAAAVFRQLGGGQLKELARALLKGVTVQLPARNGNVAEAPVLEIANVHFAGKLAELFKVLAFAAEVNFADFFDGARTLLVGFRQAAPEASPSDSPSA